MIYSSVKSLLHVQPPARGQTVNPSATPERGDVEVAAKQTALERENRDL